ncbi:related to ATG4 - essential for autophagocytosis [Cephalotrichum gorgonifer]|uniref:Cysteine protease n=1 Tax=Cephalotrichum gorgonifer TaxID=2041049 RepID=A0AAE8SUS0_9PEZI|nr:related to ATG4 - essential for autophagocytosis [Cephalotrichum gorgonifer]
MATVDFGRYKRIVQMFWDPEPTNDVPLDQPVWCLGRSYTLADEKAHHGPSGSPLNLPSSSPPLLSSFQGSDQPPPSSDAAAAAPATSSNPVPASQPLSIDHPEPRSHGGWPAAFLDDFESKLWMTYRSDFEPIPKSTDPDSLSALSFQMRVKSQLVDQGGFSSDSGWGCMIRSGQSLLANTISIQRMGRGWRRGQNSDEEKDIISMFADDGRAPYSIHNFVAHGAQFCGKYPGEWFGPSATARCIRALVNEHESDLRVYSTGDGPDVYEDEFMNIAQPDGESFHPTLILVGTRLGIDKITQVYWEALIAALQLPQSVGIAGGRPASSHYFIGAQGSYLFYLDPHHTRPALPYHSDPRLCTEDDVDSCHTRRLRRLHLNEVDPSMLIGFLIRNRDEWVEWRRSVRHVQGKPVISVTDRATVLSGEPNPGGLIDEVEALSDEEGEGGDGDDDDDDGVVVSRTI